MTNTTASVVVTHDGVTYDGQIMRIKSTMLGYEDHGILTAYLHCQYPGGGIGVGGYALDQPKDRDSRDFTRIGTAFGLDHIIQIMKTAGVDKWESLPGTDIIVLYENANGSFFGLTSVGFAGLSTGEAFIMKAHAEQWQTVEAS